MQKVQNVILYMQSLGLDLPTFLDAISWGSHACTLDGDIKAARTLLMNSRQLKNILQRWWEPPTYVSQDWKASKVMAGFMQDSLRNLLSRQLESLVEFFRPPARVDITEEVLTSIDFAQLWGKIEEHAPNLWKLLQSSTGQWDSTTQWAVKEPQNHVDNLLHKSNFQCRFSILVLDSSIALILTSFCYLYSVREYKAIIPSRKHVYRLPKPHPQALYHVATVSDSQPVPPACPVLQHPPSAQLGPPEAILASESEAEGSCAESLANSGPRQSSQAKKVVKR